MDDATVYSSDPAGQARAWQDAGFTWLHVVDLNGAFAGRPVNGAAVAAILGAVTIPVQLGGGIRDMAGIEAWLAAGIRRVILGSAAVKNPALVREACRAFPGRIVVGIDARDGKVATEGWAETSSIDARDLALSFEDAGVAAIVYTDIGRDGMLSGLNLAQTVALAGVRRDAGDRLGRRGRAAGPDRSPPRRRRHADRRRHRRARLVRRADRTRPCTDVAVGLNCPLIRTNRARYRGFGCAAQIGPGA